MLRRAITAALYADDATRALVAVLMPDSCEHARCAPREQSAALRGYYMARASIMRERAAFALRRMFSR